MTNGNSSIKVMTPEQAAKVFGKQAGVGAGGTGGGQRVHFGQQVPTDALSQFNMHAFQIRQMLRKVSSCSLAKVLSCTNQGGISPVGSVTLQPLVNLMDGVGRISPRGVLHNVPYFRVQGGQCAVICDPAIGDIGIVVFADRDISSVKRVKGQAPPGSFRRFDPADGLFIGGVLNQAPQTYVALAPGQVLMSPDNGRTFALLTEGKIELSADELILHSNKKVTVDADGVGVIYTGSPTQQVDTYLDGVPANHHPPVPPEVPT